MSGDIGKLTVTLPFTAMGLRKYFSYNAVNSPDRIIPVITPSTSFLNAASPLRSMQP
ncbi:hypothetical protein D9M69_722110 [compost metagenome]